MNKRKLEIGTFLLLLLFTQLYGQTNPKISSVLPLPDWPSVDQWDMVAENSLGEYYLLDRETGQCIHISAQGEVLHTFGGIGLGQGGLAEPVDILVKDTQVILADYSNDALVWLDRNLNWISNDIVSDLTPSLMARSGNEIMVYSYDQSVIFRRYTQYWDRTPFVDLSLGNSPLCLNHLAGNDAGRLATLTCDGRTFITYSPIGKKELQVDIDLAGAEFIALFQASWIILNNAGQYVIIKGERGQLPLPANSKIIDCYSSFGRLLILTEHEIISFTG